jgi:hypothetical protein
MALETRKTPRRLPDHLQAALDNGYLTQEQLQELITFEAGVLDLEYDEAVARAQDDTLPRTASGSDLRLLISLLAA